MKQVLPKKSLGQHWLNDEPTLEAICDLADLSSKDTVLEIGPGLGSLTQLLVKKSGQVIAIEIDDELVKKLPVLVSADNLTIIHQSILKYDLSNLPISYKLVANIPYYLTSNLLRILSESSNPPSRIVLLVQKEVAQRVAAEPGDMSLLSVTTQYYWDVSLKQIIPAEMFQPPPKVDSQVILLTRKKTMLMPESTEKSFFRLVKIGYSARRKTLQNSLANGLRMDKVQVGKLLKQVNISSTTRPQQLSVEEWQKLYEVCLSEKII